MTPVRRWLLLQVIRHAKAIVSVFEWALDSQAQDSNQHEEGGGAVVTRTCRYCRRDFQVPYEQDNQPRSVCDDCRQGRYRPHSLAIRPIGDETATLYPTTTRFDKDWRPGRTLRVEDKPCR